MYASPIFCPEMMFSYFTPNLQLFVDRELGFLGSTTKINIFKVGNMAIGFNLIKGLWKKDFNEYFKKKN